MTRRPV